MSIRDPQTQKVGCLAAGAIVAMIGGIASFSSVTHLYFMVVAMAPTIALAIIERPGNRVATTSVGALTAATVLPLLFGAMTREPKRELFDNATAWAFVGVAVSAGILIYVLLPVSAGLFHDQRLRARRRLLRDRQEALEEEWGAEVRS
jgi:hypothetical protein